MASAIVKAVPQNAEQVQVAAVEDAGTLWAVEPQGPANEMTHAKRRVQILEFCLTRKMEGAPTPPRNAPSLNELVSVRNPVTSLWNRGRVRTFDRKTGMYSVFLLDHGTTVTVKMKDIGDLPENMQNVAPEAFQVILFGLVPLKYDGNYRNYDTKCRIGDEWSKQANSVILNEINKSNIGYVLTKASNEERKVIYGEVYLVSDKGFLNLSLLLEHKKLGIQNHKLFAEKYNLKGIGYEGSQVKCLNMMSSASGDDLESLRKQPGEVMEHNKTQNSAKNYGRRKDPNLGDNVKSNSKNSSSNIQFNRGNVRYSFDDRKEQLTTQKVETELFGDGNESEFNGHISEQKVRKSWPTERNPGKKIPDKMFPRSRNAQQKQFSVKSMDHRERKALFFNHEEDRQDAVKKVLEMCSVKKNSYGSIPKTSPNSSKSNTLEEEERWSDVLSFDDLETNESDNSENNYNFKRKQKNLQSNVRENRNINEQNSSEIRKKYGALDLEDELKALNSNSGLQCEGDKYGLEVLGINPFTGTARTHSATRFKNLAHPVSPPEVKSPYLLKENNPVALSCSKRSPSQGTIDENRKPVEKVLRDQIVCDPASSGLVATEVSNTLYTDVPYKRPPKPPTLLTYYPAGYNMADADQLLQKSYSNSKEKEFRKGKKHIPQSSGVNAVKQGSDSTDAEWVDPSNLDGRFRHSMSNDKDLRITINKTSDERRRFLQNESPNKTTQNRREYSLKPGDSLLSERTNTKDDLFAPCDGVTEVTPPKELFVFTAHSGQSSASHGKIRSEPETCKFSQECYERMESHSQHHVSNSLINENLSYKRKNTPEVVTPLCQTQNNKPADEIENVVKLTPVMSRKKAVPSPRKDSTLLASYSHSNHDSTLKDTSSSHKGNNIRNKVTPSSQTQNEIPSNRIEIDKKLTAVMSEQEITISMENECTTTANYSNNHVLGSLSNDKNNTQEKTLKENKDEVEKEENLPAVKSQFTQEEDFLCRSETMELIKSAFDDSAVELDDNERKQLEAILRKKLESFASKLIEKNRKELIVSNVEELSKSPIQKCDIFPAQELVDIIADKEEDSILPPDKVKGVSFTVKAQEVSQGVVVQGFPLVEEVEIMNAGMSREVQSAEGIGEVQSTEFQGIEVTKVKCSEVPDDSLASKVEEFESVAQLENYLPAVEDEKDPSSPVIEKVLSLGKVEKVLPVAEVENFSPAAEIHKVLAVAEIDKVSPLPEVKNVLPAAEVEKMLLSAEVEKELLSAEDEKVSPVCEVKKVSPTAEVEKVSPTAEVEKVSLAAEVEKVSPAAEVEKVSPASVAEKVLPAPKFESVLTSAEVEKVLPACEVKKVSPAAEVERVSTSAEVEVAAEVEKDLPAAEDDKVLTSTEVEKVSPVCEVEKVSAACEVEKVSRACEVEKVSPGAEVEKVSLAAEVEKVSPAAEVGRVSTSAEVEKVSSAAEVDKVSSAAEVEKDSPAAEDVKDLPAAEDEKISQVADVEKVSPAVQNKEDSLTMLVQKDFLSGQEHENSLAANMKEDFSTDEVQDSVSIEKVEELSKENAQKEVRSDDGNSSMLCNSPDHSIKKPVKPKYIINPVLHSNSCDGFAADPSKMFMDQLQSLIVLLHGTSSDFKPLNSVTDAGFRMDVHEALKRKKLTRLFRLDRYAWPAIHQGSDFVLVGPRESGKTLGYLVPSVDLLLQNLSSGKIPKGSGPVLLILCSGSKSCNYIHENCWELVRESSKDVKIVVAYGGGAENVEHKLANGCHILISTPRCFQRLLAKGRLVVNFARLKYLVFDEADVLTLRFLPEIELISGAVKRGVLSRGGDIGGVQVVVVAEKWCPGVEGLARSLTHPIVCVAALLEAIAYAHLKPQLHHVTDDTRLETLYEVLKEEGYHHKIMVVCETSELAYAAAETLQVLQLPLLLAPDDMESSEIHDLIQVWNRAAHIILVCTDAALQELRFRGASFLVHLDLPQVSKTQFAFRCGTLIERLPSMFADSDTKESTVSPRMHIFISDTVKEPLPELRRFVKRLGITLDPDLEKRAAMAELEKERKKEGIPLCKNTKVFGDCWNKSACVYRHVFGEVDKPQNIPVSGSVKVNVLNYLDACCYTARLLEHTDENGNTTKIPNSVLKIANGLTKHFKNGANRVLLENPKVYDICAAEKYVDGLVVYQRAELVTIAKVMKNKRTKWLVKFIDDGSYGFLEEDSLFELPDDLKALPPQSVELVLCKLIPCDLDWSWGEASRERVLRILDNATAHDKFLVGKIVLALGHTLWLESLECYQHLPTLKTSTIKFSLKRRLLDEGVAVENPLHVQRLRDACERAGLPLPSLQPISFSGSVVGKTEDKVEARWAFLPQDEFSIVHFISGDHPSRFYVRLQKFEDLFHKLGRKLQKLADEKSVKDRALFAGDFCIGRFPEDENWYRARVEDAQDDRLELFFVDHGDRAFVSKSEAFPLPRDLITQLPFQAIECSMAGISPLEGDKWSDDAIDYLYAVTAKPDTLDGVKMLYTMPVADSVPADNTGGRRYSVVLVACSDPDKSLINDTFISRGVAKETPLLKELKDSIDLSKLIVLEDTSGSEFEGDDDDESPQLLQPDNAEFAGLPVEGTAENWDSVLPSTTVSSLGMDNTAGTVVLEDAKLSATEKEIEERLAGFNIDEIDEDEITEFFTSCMSHYRGRKCLEGPSDATGTDVHSSPEKPIEVEERVQPLDSFSEEESIISETDTEEKDTGSGYDPCMPVLVSTTRRPQVLWHQSTYAVWVRVDLPGTEDYYLHWGIDNLSFWTRKCGEVYAFDITLFGGVNPHKVEHSGGLFVQIKLPKLVLGVDWPRLTKQRRVPWVKIDYSAEHEREDEEAEVQRQVQAHLRAVQEAQRKQLGEEDEFIIPADEVPSSDSDAESDISDIVTFQEEQYDPYDPLN